jgi:hypothetical protein
MLRALLILFLYGFENMKKRRVFRNEGRGLEFLENLALPPSTRRFRKTRVEIICYTSGAHIFRKFNSPLQNSRCEMGALKEVAY